MEGAYSIEQFTIDWERAQVICPQGKVSRTWTPQVNGNGNTKISVKFRQQDCDACPERMRCTRAKTMPRHLYFYPRAQYEALEAARARFGSETGKELYTRRAGIEGTLSRGVRAIFSLSGHNTDLLKILRALLERLADTLCYAAYLNKIEL